MAHVAAGALPDNPCRRKSRPQRADTPLVIVDGPTPVDGTNAWHRFAHEVLGHLRLPYTRVDMVDAAQILPPRGVVVFTTPPSLRPTEATRLLEWVAAGNAMIVVGGPGTVALDLDLPVVGSVANGHVQWHDGVRAMPDRPLRAFGGVVLQPAPVWRELARWTTSTGVAVASRAWEAGTITVLGVDLWQTVVRVLQGDPVDRDGVPAHDGSAPVDDDILKCDDGVTLDYVYDRAQPPGAPALPGERYEYVFPVEQVAPMFDRPQADVWRGVLAELVFDRLAATGQPAAWVDYWPNGLPAIVHVSLDSDGNDSDHAMDSLELLRQLDTRVTWCHQFPGGYRQQVIDGITDDGHEHALHYNAMADAPGATWGEQAFHDQVAWLQAVLGDQPIVSNKNHFTRWEAWVDLFLWCERAGIQADETRGGSKPGNAGFPFGASHPWFPMGPAEEANRPLDVLALPLHTQDLSLVAHESIRDVILDQVSAAHGLAHFLFHPTHLATRRHVRDALAALVTEVRRRGLPIWTCARINRWHRGRRSIDLAIHRRDPRGVELRVAAPADIDDDVTCLVTPTDPGADHAAWTETGDPLPTSWVERHGQRFVAVSVPVRAGSTTIRLSPLGAEDLRASHGLPTADA